MAEIFKAKQPGARGFEKIVVIKRILQHLSEDPEFVEMFENEAKLAALLNQANIVQIYELGEVDETLYITMEYVDGKNLRDVTRATAGRGIHLSIEQSVMIISESLKGLDYAHRRTDSAGQALDIIHRDISPQNIILSYEGEVKILDFGIAKAASKISKTEAGVLKGKFSYMSPEQASGKPITQTTDVYAIGVILHELLTSDRLFRSKTDMETLEKVKDGYVAAPSEKNPEVPKELDAIVLKALAKNPSERYASASEMLMELNRFAFEQRFVYNAQDLAVFMKTLFADSIKEEKSRLIQALAQIPQNPLEKLQNARTHIAFKRTFEELGNASTQASGASNDMTQTFDKKSVTVQRKGFRGLGLMAILAVIMGSTYFLVRAPSSNDAPTDPPPVVKAEPKLEIPAPEVTDTKRLDEVLGKPEIPLEAPSDAVQPEMREKPDLPPARPIPPAPKQSPKIKKPPAEAVSLSRVNVTAPPSGFANLFINNQAKGTVPGPNARNIPLPPGRHSIRCETSSHVYSGEIIVKENETITVRCQELKSD